MAISGVGNQVSPAMAAAAAQVTEEVDKIKKKEATVDPQSVATQSVNPPPQVESSEAAESTDVNAFLKSLESSLADIERSAKDAGSKIKMVAHFVKELLNRVPEDVKALIKEGNINEELHAAFNDNKTIARLAAQEDQSIKNLLS